MKLSLLLLLTMLGCSLGLKPATAQALKVAESATIPGKAVLKLRPGAQPSQLEAALNSAGATALQQKFPRALPPSAEQPGSVEIRTIYQFDFPATTPLSRVRKLLLSTGAVEYVEPLYLRQPLYVPNDPRADSTVTGGQYYLKNIRAYGGWDVTKSDSTVVIGIVDSGIYLTHQELRNQIKYNYADPIDGIDNDGDGFVDNFRGWDTAENDNDPRVNTAIGGILTSHGTLVTGCATARADNGRGIAGVGFNCRFLPVKVFSQTNGNLFGGFEGIVYAADHGCKVINFSWGGAGGKSQFEQDICTYAAVNRNAVLVSAAGNTNAQLDFYPASYDHVLSVATLNPDDTRSGNATHSYFVDLTAPGIDILTTTYLNDSSYIAVGGSSFASPIVAGVAGLMRKQFPLLTADQIATRLKRTADDIYAVGTNAQYQNLLGTGRVNARRALATAGVQGLLLTATRYTRPQPAPNDTLHMRVTVQNMLDAVQGLQLTVTSMSPYVQVVTTSPVAVGSLTNLVTLASGTSAPVKLKVLPTVPLYTTALLRCRFTAPNGFQQDEFVQLVVNPDYVTLDANDLHLTVTSRGNLGYDGLGSELGQSVTYRNSPPLLYEGGLMVATNSIRVSDRVRNNQGGSDMDFYSVARMTFKTPLVATQEAYGVLQDSFPAKGRTVGVRIRQRAYAWNTPSNTDYVILEYTLKNITTDTLRPLAAGLFMDWDLPPLASRNVLAWDSARRMAYAYDPVLPTTYVGLQLLRGGTTSCYAMSGNDPANSPVYIADGLSSLEKYRTLTSGTTRRTAGGTTGADISSVVGTVITRLAPSDSVRIAFAVLGAASLPQLQAAATAAQLKYAQVLPTKTAAAAASWQAYPNPTTGLLRLSVPAAAQVRSAVLYNSLGQKVGEYALPATETELNLSALAPGVYQLQLIGPGPLLTRRIVVQR